MKKKLYKSLFFLFIFAMTCEAGLRLSGIADFPLYDADSVIGYIPKASQSGVFLRKNDWAFNTEHMGAVEFSPTDAIDDLLVGDSVVLGGNPYKQNDRLGPRLSKILKEPVWPISAGSWSLRNELIYLRLHPEVVQGVDRIIFVLDSGDFEEASSWSCEETHPRTYPFLVSMYVFKKYIYNWSPCGEVPRYLKVSTGNWQLELHGFISSEQVRGKPIFFILYPDKAEVLDSNKLQYDLEVHTQELISASAQCSVWGEIHAGRQSSIEMVSILRSRGQVC